MQKITMNGQCKILAFFAPTAKRTAKSFSENSSPKKLKTSQTEACNKVCLQNNELDSPKKHELQGEYLQLTPEQKSRIEKNKKAALARLQDKENKNALANSTLLINVGSSWCSALSAEFSKPYFKELTKFVEAERKKGTVYPPADQVFTWTTMCKISEVKVVMLGQDPYHGPRQAHGLCFSVQKGITPPPSEFSAHEQKTALQTKTVAQCASYNNEREDKTSEKEPISDRRYSHKSLENMFKELLQDIEGFQHPGHGTLTGWAKQGVLLLNACLTVRAHQANSHQGKGWEQFTDAVISWLNKNSSGIVFMLWGSYAQKKGACIDKKKHHVLTAVHPSPLSAHRGFFGCKHFSQCNKLLQKNGKTPIDWTKLPEE